MSALVASLSLINSNGLGLDCPLVGQKANALQLQCVN